MCDRVGGVEARRGTNARWRAHSSRFVQVRLRSAVARSLLAMPGASGRSERGTAFESRVYAATRPGRGDGGGGGLRGRRERDAALSCVKLGDRVGRSLIVPASELLSHVHTHRLTHTLPHTLLSFSLSLKHPVQVGPNRGNEPTLRKPTRHHTVTHVHTDRHTRAPDRYLSYLTPCFSLPRISPAELVPLRYVS